MPKNKNSSPSPPRMCPESGPWSWRAWGIFWVWRTLRSRWCACVPLIIDRARFDMIKTTLYGRINWKTRTGEAFNKIKTNWSSYWSLLLLFAPSLSLCRRDFRDFFFAHLFCLARMENSCYLSSDVVARICKRSENKLDHQAQGLSGPQKPSRSSIIN